jgi:hypothetical protein
MSAQTMAAGIGEGREVAGVGEAYAFAQEPMSVIEICTKPLTRRTLPRVRGSAVVEVEISWFTEKGGPRDPTTPKDAGGTPAS